MSDNSPCKGKLTELVHKGGKYNKLASFAWKNNLGFFSG